MKKNIFLFVLSFFSFFLFSNNVKAEEIVDFKISNTLVNADGYDFSEKLEELEQALKSTGKEYVIVLRRLFENIDYYSYIEKIYLFDTVPSINFSNTISIPYSSAKKYIVSRGDIISETYLNSLIAIVQNGSYLNNTTNSSISLYQNSGSFNTLYSSSFDIINTSSYTYRFNNDYSVKNNEKIYTLKTLPKPVQLYTENLTIDTKNIDRIEYTFDFESEMNEVSHFVHDFNFSISWDYENSSWNLFDYPYLQYKKDSLIYELPLKDKTIESLDSLIYADTQLNPFTDIEELKFIVPIKKLSSFDNSSIFIHFDSNLNFEKKIYTVDENNPNINPNPGGLNLKNSFNSGTNAYGMGKITWSVMPGTDLSLLDGKTWFKIQYGSNDFTNKNIPFISRYRIFGKNTNDSEWNEIKDSDLIYIDNVNYKYDLSETTMTGVLRIPYDKCIYEQLQIEFYFDNTVNFYMYVYDDLLEEENWIWTEKFLENYRYYEFPKNMRYGFVSHKKNYDNSGIVYVPYNFTINENTLFSVSVLDYNTDMILRNIDSKEFIEDNYYSYYDFNFSHKNNELLMLKRKKSNEKLYFYVHEDYIVTFTDTKESILTPDGFVEIDTSKIFDILDKDEDTSLFSMFHFFEKPVKFLFDGVGTLYNNYVPVSVQKYWYFGLGFTVFIIILKLLF